MQRQIVDTMAEDGRNHICFKAYPFVYQFLQKIMDVEDCEAWPAFCWNYETPGVQEDELKFLKTVKHTLTDLQVSVIAPPLIHHQNMKELSGYSMLYQCLIIWGIKLIMSVLNGAK